MARSTDISWIKDKTFILALFAIIFLVSPGLAVMAFYFPQSLTDFDWSKLILFSIAFTSPLSIINTIFLPPEDEVTGDDTLFNYFVRGCLATAILIYFPLVIAYYFESSINQYLTYVVYGTVAFIAGEWAIHIIKRRFSKKS